MPETDASGISGVIPVLRCVCCFMYAAMFAVRLYDDVLSINVNMLEVASEWSVHPLLMIPKLIYSELS